jgi:hypothetical protein
MFTVLIHLQNEDPILGEVGDLPALTDTMVLVKNPRRKDGKDIHYLDPQVSQVYWPLTRITFIEVMPSGEEDEIISFVRE